MAPLDEQRSLKNGRHHLLKLFAIANVCGIDRFCRSSDVYQSECLRGEGPPISFACAGFAKVLVHLVDECLGSFRSLRVPTQDLSEWNNPVIEVLGRIIVLPYFCAAQFHARKQPLGSRVTED